MQERVVDALGTRRAFESIALVRVIRTCTHSVTEQPHVSPSPISETKSDINRCEALHCVGTCTAMETIPQAQRDSSGLVLVSLNPLGLHSPNNPIYSRWACAELHTIFHR